MEKNFWGQWLIFCLAIIPFLLISNLLFLKDPPIWPDEALFIDTAKNLASTGKLASNLLGDTLPGFEEHAYWTPPFYLYLLGGVIKVFGEGIEIARVLSLALGLGSLVFIFLIAKYLFCSSVFAFLAVLLISFDIWFSKTARLVRMDILAFFFLLAACLFFLLAQNRAKFLSLRLYVLTGLFSGLGLITHPLGAIAPLLVTILLLFNLSSWKKKTVELGVFLLPQIFIVSWWLLSMKGSLDIFLTQYQLQLARKAQEAPFVLSIFQENFSWKLIFFIYICLTACLALQIKKLKKWGDIFILTGLVISSTILIWGKEMWYLLYFQPFIVLAALSLVKNSQSTLKMIFVMLALTWAVLNLNLTFSQVNNSNYYLFTQKIKESLPEGSIILLSSIPDPYFGLVDQKSFTLYEFPPVPIPFESYKKLLDQTDFMVVNIIPDQTILNYVRQNTATSSTIQSMSYTTTLVQLVSRDKRK